MPHASPFASPPPVHDSSGTLRDWRVKIFTSVWVTYFSYYLCRMNMPVAGTRLSESYGWSNEDFGIIVTALTVMYAVGQFVNGQLADRFGTRIMVGLGAFGSVAMNLAVFAVAMALPEKADARTVLWMMAGFWGLNGFFQSMGWSPMVRMMAHWFPVQGRGKVMGFLGTCYQFGGAAAWLLAMFLTGYYAQELGGDWRMVFAVPAALFAVVGAAFCLIVRNQPEDVGLPPVDHGDGPAHGPSAASRGERPARASLAANLMRTIENPYVWIVAGVFFLLDVNRYGFVNWLPKYLDTVRDPAVAGSLMANFKEMMTRCIHPLAGSAGAIMAGWATDRFFGGRRAPVIAVLLALLGGFSILFPYIDPNDTLLVFLVVAMVGFCTYGPHILMVGHAAQDFGKKSGAAGAAGFIDAIGYIGASLAGWGAGRLIDLSGYRLTFSLFGLAAIAGGALAVLIWRVGPDSHSPKSATASASSKE